MIKKIHTTAEIEVLAANMTRSNAQLVVRAGRMLLDLSAERTSLYEDLQQKTVEVRELSDTVSSIKAQLDKANSSLEEKELLNFQLVNLILTNIPDFEIFYKLLDYRITNTLQALIFFYKDKDPEKAVVVLECLERIGKAIPPEVPKTEPSEGNSNA